MIEQLSIFVSVIERFSTEVHVKKTKIAADLNSAMNQSELIANTMLVSIVKYIQFHQPRSQ